MKIQNAILHFSKNTLVEINSDELTTVNAGSAGHAYSIAIGVERVFFCS